jgi:hypothetical protein
MVSLGNVNERFFFDSWKDICMDLTSSVTVEMILLYLEMNEWRGKPVVLVPRCHMISPLPIRRKP